MIEYQGKKFARVSEVLQPFTNFEGIDKKILERKAIVGTRVHEAIADDIKGDFPIILPELLGYFKSYEKWRTQISPVFLEAERRYYDHEKRITGQIDALIKLQGEEGAVLIDFKTSVAESPTWIMQAHLYSHLLALSGKPVSNRYLFIKLSKDGALPIVFHYRFNHNIHQKCMQAIDDFWLSVDINPLLA